ncbi:fibrillarin-like rRNA/tRNA 2'-O-methyltransferase [Candidatus Woesearchaeota archaeon]|nr:fibrillarin-like rRNA/tRNA 2'-O-methyltransferase [Candidatus Woesearchaeota archaeon]
MIVKKGKVLVEQRYPVNPFSSRQERHKGTSYLVMDPKRSKLAAGLKTGLQHPPQEHDIVLYLGASAGYTVSFLAQQTPLLLAVEFSPVMMQELLFIAQELPTIAPLLADARQPEQYEHRLCEADYLFCDISQRDQVDIFNKHLKYLRRGGIGALALKTRSINAVTPPDIIFKKVLNTLQQRMEIVEHHRLEPYQKDHYLIIIRNDTTL